MYRIMLVDDDANTLKALRRELLDSNLDSHLIESFASPLDALERAKVTAFDLVISDHVMPEMDGVELLARFRRMQPLASCVLLSGVESAAMLKEAINHARATYFLSKPWQKEQLRDIMARSLLEAEYRKNARRLEELVRDQQLMIESQAQALRRYQADHWLACLSGPPSIN